MTKTSLDKTKIKILLLEGVHPSAVERLQADGYTNIECHRKSLAAPDLERAAGDAYFVGIRSATQLDREFFDHATRLTGVGCFCIGTNQVDLAAAEERGIPVFNAPFSNTRSVAELVLAEVVALLRGIPERNAAAHRGKRLKTATGSHEARGKQVVYYDIESRLALGNACAAQSLDGVLEVSDVVTLHVPETPATLHMIARRQLARMKRGARLINASRGTVVEIDALAEALQSGQLGGAAIDVFPEEPAGGAQEFLSPLRGMDNVLLTPHIGGSTVEAQENIGIEVAGKLIKYSNNGSTLGAVNFPQVSLPEYPGKNRVLHIHRNQPGVLSAINAVFSAEEINIAGEYLQTDAKVGYVVIDIEAGDRAETVEIRRKLELVPGTIRTRILY